MLPVILYLQFGWGCKLICYKCCRNVEWFKLLIVQGPMHIRSPNILDLVTWEFFWKFDNVDKPTCGKLINLYNFWFWFLNKNINQYNALYNLMTWNGSGWIYKHNIYFNKNLFEDIYRIFYLTIHSWAFISLYTECAPYAMPRTVLLDILYLEIAFWAFPVHKQR